MDLQPGDRVRWLTTGDDGLPLVRYGFVGAGVHNGEVRVMLDGDLKGNTVLPADDLLLTAGQNGLIYGWNAACKCLFTVACHAGASRRHQAVGDIHIGRQRQVRTVLLDGPQRQQRDAFRRHPCGQFGAAQ